MHVAYIHQHFATRKSATGTRSYEMSRRLIDAGHRVSMICGINEATQSSLDHGQRINKMEIDGIEVYCIAEQYSNKMSFARRLWAFWRFMRTAAQIAGGLDADLVFATSTPLTVGVPGMKAARRLGVPFVFEVRDLWPELPISMGILRNPLLKWYTRRLERKIYQAADSIIALSPGIKDGICKTGYPADRVNMIPNGCDLDLFQPSSEPLDDERYGAPDDFRLIFTGAHGIANGLDAVLDAAVVLKKRGVSGIRLVFIGQGGLKPGLMQRSRQQGLEDLVIWADPVSKNELARILPGMDAGMMILQNLPAFYYGTSPNKFFDYIACGLPVLNNYPGWLADMITERRCGIAVQPNDAKSFADAVLRLRDDRAAARTMGERGRMLAEERFERSQLAGQFVKTLERLFADRRSM